MILLIDNYDSFTYNLVQYLQVAKCDVLVKRNDELSVNDIEALDISHIIISPGPGNPSDAGISCDVIRRFAGRIPLLGVCLGHQCIASVFGGQIVHAKKIMHGKTSRVHHKHHALFDAIDSPLTVTRYHSLIVESASLPDCLQIIAWTKNEEGKMNEIMGIAHINQKVLGVQFHPEAILTEFGHQLLLNFLSLKK